MNKSTYVVNPFNLKITLSSSILYGLECTTLFQKPSCHQMSWPSLTSEPVTYATFFSDDCIVEFVFNNFIFQSEDFIFLFLMLLILSAGFAVFYNSEKFHFSWCNLSYLIWKCLMSHFLIIPLVLLFSNLFWIFGLFIFALGVYC